MIMIILQLYYLIDECEFLWRRINSSTLRRSKSTLSLSETETLSMKFSTLFIIKTEWNELQSTLSSELSSSLSDEQSLSKTSQLRKIEWLLIFIILTSSLKKIITSYLYRQIFSILSMIKTSFSLLISLNDSINDMFIQIIITSSQLSVTVVKNIWK